MNLGVIVKQTIRAFSAAGFILGGVAAGAHETTPLDELFAKVRRSREKIHSIELELHIKRTIEDKQVLEELTGYEGVLHIWLDGDQLRGDRIIDSRRDIRTIHCLNCYEGDKFVDFSTEPLPGGGARALSIRDTQYMTVTDAVPQPRYIGLIPTFVEAAPQFRIDSAFQTALPESVRREQAERRIV